MNAATPVLPVAASSRGGSVVGLPAGASSAGGGALPSSSPPAVPCQFCKPKIGAGLVFHMAGSWCPLENRPRPVMCKNRRSCFAPTTRPDGWCSDECKRGGI